MKEIQDRTSVRVDHIPIKFLQSNSILLLAGTRPSILLPFLDLLPVRHSLVSVFFLGLEHDLEIDVVCHPNV